jgi:integrase
MAKMEPRWDKSNQRWECSLGSGANRVWFRSKVQGPEGRALVQQKLKAFLDGPDRMESGSFEEFIETVWWPRIMPSCTYETQRYYLGTLNKHIRHFYGRPIAGIRLEDLQPWISGIDLSPKSVRNIYGVMSGILELAHKTGRYPLKDHRLVVLPEIVKEKKPITPAGNIRKIIEKSKGSFMEGPVWVAAHLGLRRNEVCGLKVPHIEINGDAAIVTVQDNRQAHGETRKLKSKPTGQARRLHLPAWMAEKLLSFREEGSIYIFHADGKPIHPKRITNNMAALCREAGVPVMRFHDLRHACRSLLSDMGVPETVIMEILGHTDYQASLGYQGEQAQRQREAFEKIGRM